MGSTPFASSSSGLPEPVAIPVRDAVLEGELVVPHSAMAIVVFAHGSGSNRFIERNRCVARRLQRSGFATLLLDLLTSEEEKADAALQTRHRFDILLLGRRLVDTTDWLLRESQTMTLPIGYFGASTAGAVALAAAAERPNVAGAIVSSSGRPDLAGPAVWRVRAPTLLVVGGGDALALDVNRDARNTFACPCQLSVIPRATHLFEEAGALELVADLASDWFGRHLASPLWTDPRLSLEHCDTRPREAAPKASRDTKAALLPPLPLR